METFLRRCAAALLLASLAVTALAQETDTTSAKPPIYFGGTIGYVWPDSDRDAEGPYTGRAFMGVPISPRNYVELGLFGTRYRRDEGSGHDVGTGLGGDFVHQFSDATLRPFVSVGAGYLYEENRGDEGGDIFGNVGLGALMQVSPNAFLRAEGRFISTLNDTAAPGDDPLNDIQASLGLQAMFGGKAAAAAPPPVDSDGDGVTDDLDQCPNTPAGTPVNAKGCPLDDDGDGVANDSDRCPNTPAGAPVDASGCPMDSDGDGVADYMDKCPNTPSGLRVDPEGCVHEAQSIVLQNINFEFGKASLTSDSRPALTQVANGLTSQPDMIVEIAGHTDSVGSNSYNQKLSQQRAESVRTFLVSQGVPPTQLKAKGYGETKPVASNKTPEGRAQNRRVEFVVLSK